MTRTPLFDDLDVSRETIERLETYLALLKKWSPKINLVAKSTLNDAWERHVLDSAQLMPLLPKGTRQLADLGSGAGFPGLVLAILSREQAAPFDVMLVESDRRKATFLREAVRETEARAEVMIQRVENFDTQVDVVTARGFTALDRLLGMAHPIIGKTGHAVLHKGARYESELTNALEYWHMEVEKFTSRIEPASVILRISGLERRQDKP